MVHFDLLLEFFCPCVFHVLSQDFEFFVAFGHFVFELPYLFLKRHY